MTVTMKSTGFVSYPQNLCETVISIRFASGVASAAVAATHSASVFTQTDSRPFSASARGVTHWLAEIVEADKDVRALRAVEGDRIVIAGTAGDLSERPARRLPPEPRRGLATSLRGSVSSGLCGNHALPSAMAGGAASAPRLTPAARPHGEPAQPLSRPRDPAISIASSNIGLNVPIVMLVETFVRNMTPASAVSISSASASVARSRNLGSRAGTGVASLRGAGRR